MIWQVKVTSWYRPHHPSITDSCIKYYFSLQSLPVRHCPLTLSQPSDDTCLNTVTASRPQPSGDQTNFICLPQLKFALALIIQENRSPEGSPENIIYKTRQQRFDVSALKNSGRNNEYQKTVGRVVPLGRQRIVGCLLCLHRRPTAMSIPPFRDSFARITETENVPRSLCEILSPSITLFHYKERPEFTHWEPGDIV